jgi:DNA-directed RNA polymerase alpha subunit
MSVSTYIHTINNMVSLSEEQLVEVSTLGHDELLEIFKAYNGVIEFQRMFIDRYIHYS